MQFSRQVDKSARLLPSVLSSDANQHVPALNPSMTVSRCNARTFNSSHTSGLGAPYGTERTISVMGCSWKLIKKHDMVRWGSIGLAPRLLNLGARDLRSASRQAVLSPWNEYQHPLSRWLDRRQRRYERIGAETNQSVSVIQKTCYIILV